MSGYSDIWLLWKDSKVGFSRERALLEFDISLEAFLAWARGLLMFRLIWENGSTYRRFCLGLLKFSS